MSMGRAWLASKGDTVSSADVLRHGFRSLEVNGDYSEAILELDDESRLQFCHRVGQRMAKAAGADEAAGDAPRAAVVLSKIAWFRLNARHLDVQFTDGSRWETLFAASGA